MTAEECLLDEKEFLEEMLTFFQKIKYGVMVTMVQKRIIKVEEKIKSLTELPEKVY